MYEKMLFDKYKTYSDEELKEITVSNGYTKEAEEVAMQILHGNKTEYEEPMKQKDSSEFQTTMGKNDLQEAENRDGRELVTVLKCGDGTLTFPECSLEPELLVTKLLLQEHLQADKYTPEVCLEQINNRPQNDFLVTVKSNLDLVNKAVEKITQKMPLRKGERIFLFCSRGEVNSVYGISSLIGNGYLVTSKRILLWNGKDICIFPMAEIQSLEVDTSSFHWCLNGLKDANLYRRNQNKEELALILSLIFLLVKEESGGKVIVAGEETDVSEKTRGMAGQPQMQAQAAKQMLPLTERLREAKALYDEGLVTESEYAELREKILDKFV